MTILTIDEGLDQLTAAAFVVMTDDQRKIVFNHVEA